MYRPNDNLGLGNILIKLCQVDTVSEKIRDGGRGKFLQFHGLNIIRDDTDVEVINPPIFINSESNKRIRSVISPTEHAQSYIDKYKYLVEGVEFGIQVRRGALSCDSRMAIKSSIQCDDTSLLKFFDIVRIASGPVFLSCDCIQTKHRFREAFGDKIRFIDESAEFLDNDITSQDPWVSFTDFFLLGMCPYVYITGGARDMYTFSTFGFMACMYGNKRWIPIFNDAYESIHVPHITSTCGKTEKK